MADGNYSRIYYEALQAEYPDVWWDDAALAAFMRMLALAEGLWPTRPEIPRSVPAEAVEILTRVGLLVVLPRGLYAIKGLDKERNARSTAGRNAARSRWGNADSNADGNAERNAVRNARPRPSTETESSTKTPALSAAQKGRRPRANGTNPRALGTNPRANGKSPRQVLKADKRDTSVLDQLRDALQARADAEALARAEKS